MLDAKDTASAAAAAAAQGERVEDLSQRTENVSVYLEKNGNITQRDFGGTVRVKQSGDWVPVDYTLVKQADGTYAPKASDLDITVDGGSAKEAARVTRDDGTSLAFTWPTNLPEPSVDGGVATYKISEATDLVVAVTGSGVTARIRLNEKPADNDPVFKLGLRADGVDVDQTATGALKITDEAGKTVGSTTQLSAWDATTDAAGDPANVVDLDADLNTTSTNGDVTQHTLELSTPDGWLSDPDRSWPTWIDPDISMTKTRDTWVRDGDTAKGSDFKLIVGKIDPAASTNSNPTRSYLKFYNGIVEAANNIEIVSAELGLWQYYGYDCNARRMYVYPVGTEWSDAITWANKPAIVTGNGATNIETNRGATGCGDGWTTVNLTAMAKAWNAGTVDMQGIRLSAGDETKSGFERRFCSMNPDASIGSCGTAARRPYLDVTYNTRPVVASAEPAATVGTDGQWTFGTTVSDPDGQIPWAEFSIKRGSVEIFRGLSTSGTSTQRYVEVGNLPAGSYTVSARAYDGRLYSATESGSRAFTVAEDMTDMLGLSLTLPATGVSTTLTLAGNAESARPTTGIVGMPSDGSVQYIVVSARVSGWSSGGMVSIYNTDLEDNSTNGPVFGLGLSSVLGLESTSIVELSSTGEFSVRNSSANPVSVTLTVRGWYSKGSYFDSDESDETASTEQAWQDSISVYKDGLIAAADATGKFTDSEVDFSSQMIVLYGVGPMPLEVSDIIDSAPAGLNVVWSSVPYTADQLEGAIETVATSLSGHVASARFRDDYSGVEVTPIDPMDDIPRLDYPEDGTAFAPSQSPGQGFTATDLAVAAQSASPIPVTMQPKADQIGTKPIADRHRWSDISPFIGGSRIWAESDVQSQAGNLAGCSTAFMVDVLSARGKSYGGGLLTASHCTENGYLSWKTWKSDRYVRKATDRESRKWDSRVIWTKDYKPAVYSGVAAEPRNFRGVTGSKSVSKNDRVCLSGSFSGRVCNNKVVDTHARSSGGGYAILVENTDGDASAGPGDSGGPAWVAQRIRGKNYAQAVGVIVEAEHFHIDKLPYPRKVSDVRECKGVPTGEWTDVCTRRTLIIPIKTIEKELNVKLRTNGVKK